MGKILLRTSAKCTGQEFEYQSDLKSTLLETLAKLTLINFAHGIPSLNSHACRTFDQGVRPFQLTGPFVSLDVDPDKSSPSNCE